MLKRFQIARFPLLACAVCVLFIMPGQARAQGTSVSASFSVETKEATPINVLVGQSRVINFDKPIGRFSVSNPEIAEAVLVAPDQVLVNGKAFGQVNFIAWEQKSGQFLVFDVFVRANLSLIDSQIRALFPKDDIRLSQANGSVVISGSVTNPKTAEQIDAVVQAAGFKTVNMLQTPVKDSTQVQLQVRVAEVSRNKLRELGSAWSTAQGGTSVGSTTLASVFDAANLFLSSSTINSIADIRAMQQSGVIRALAEPNVIAMNGQTASFLAGGEFPIPVIQSDGVKVSITVVFKEYGVRLNFKPTVIDEDHIQLELEPEVSTIDFQNGVKFQGYLIPALKTRRAKTGIELRDGQSFALAGLLDNNESKTISKVPGLGDIPVLGALFKSTSFEKKETELVFFCTVQIVKPSNRDDLPQLRGIDGLKNGSPLGVEPKGEGIQGPHGFSTGDGQTTSSTATPPTTLATNAPAPVQPATQTATPVAPATGDGKTTTVTSGAVSATASPEEKAALPALNEAATLQASVKPKP